MGFVDTRDLGGPKPTCRSRSGKLRCASSVYDAIVVARNSRFWLRLTLVLALVAPDIRGPIFDTGFLGRIVVFLYASTADGQVDRSKPVGTGFLIRIPHEHDSEVAILMLTARHILDPQWVRCPQQRNPEVPLRAHQYA